ncbi:MAG TPA: STAS domain-containing protein [Jatrophihabitans sp.]|uniref:STAS domain-containing protein n=1 Tax=Jatrophihabitans sp. TaxID=1932789 RepID=UPI002E05D9C5|nr:STAS domain-containing protein [Jatrophihabitans sp.]
MADFCVTSERDADTAVLALEGELDFATLAQLRAAADVALDDRTVSVIVLDLRALRFLDSSGLGLWVELHDRAARCGKSLQLRAVPAATQRVLELGGLASLFHLV